MRVRRPRIAWLAMLVVVVLLGLGSRRFGDRLPAFVAAYAGDTLWATAAFLGFGLSPTLLLLRLPLQGVLLLWAYAYTRR